MDHGWVAKMNVQKTQAVAWHTPIYGAFAPNDSEFSVTTSEAHEGQFQADGHI